MNIAAYIDDLASKGLNHFSTNEAIQALRASPASVRAQLRRAKARGHIASPVRSFWVIVPPAFRRLDCLPGDRFIDQLMSWLGEPYYLTLLSAAERHGAAHQRPQALQVMVRTNRSSITCGKVRIDFSARGNLAEIPTVMLNTQSGFLRCATPEVTALELIGYPARAGGLNNAATILTELAEAIDANKLTRASNVSPVAWSQRLGYLFETLGLVDLAQALEPFVRTHAHRYTPLRQSTSSVGATRSSRWKVIINTDIDPDL